MKILELYSRADGKTNSFELKYYERNWLFSSPAINKTIFEKINTTAAQIISRNIKYSIANIYTDSS